MSNVPLEEAETDGGIPSCQGLAQAFSVGGIGDGAANVACGPHVIHSNAIAAVDGDVRDLGKVRLVAEVGGDAHAAGG